ncbi:MAG: helicase, partial [Pirellulales bacterium]
MTTQVRKTRPTNRLSLHDRLSRLTFLQACKLLGKTGKKLIQQSANLWDINIAEDVFFGGDLFRLRIPNELRNGQPVVVTITLMAEARDRLHWHCSCCEV